MMGILRGVITFALLLSFIAVVAWAWSGRRRKEFESMARLALDEDAAEQKIDSASPSASQTRAGGDE